MKDQKIVTSTRIYDRQIIFQFVAIRIQFEIVMLWISCDYIKWYYTGTLPELGILPFDVVWGKVDREVGNWY